MVNFRVKIKLKGIKLERYNKLSRDQKRIVKLAAAAVLVVALSLAAFFLADSILGRPGIYSGVSIEGCDVGGMTPEALHAFLTDRYGNYLNDYTITFFANDFEKSVTLSDLGISVDIEKMEKNALGVGKDGFFIKRLMEISKLKKDPISVPMSVRIDENRLNTVIEDVNRYFRVDVTAPKIVISGDKAVLCTGVSGWEVDSEALKSKIIESLDDLKNTLIHIPLKEIVPPSIDVETVYNSILQSPANAAIVKNADGTASVKPQVNGRSIDKDQLAEIINEAESGEIRDYKEIELPVKVVEPEVKTRDLDALLYRDVLATASTSFTADSQNNKNRGINIRIAAQAIDGKVVFPGEEFSFNDVVGPRTADKGYVIAHIFSEGQIKNGLGGGICQVSTTLYDAALWANMGISERHNHIFAVGYVPLGLDAAISYGSYDLRFRNTTDYPVRIDAKVSGNNILTFSIAGTNMYPDIKVKTVTKTLSTTRATVEYKDDPTLAAGTEAVDEYGIDGAVVETYVEIYNGKDLIKNYKIHTSTYQMVPKKVRKGTKAG